MHGSRRSNLSLTFVRYEGIYTGDEVLDLAGPVLLSLEDSRGVSVSGDDGVDGNNNGR